MATRPGMSAMLVTPPHEIGNARERAYHAYLRAL
jgi:hypothetical protein